MSYRVLSQGPNRVCKQCGVDKPLIGGFNKKGVYWQVRCMECSKQRNKNRHRNNREADLAANKAWYDTNKHVHRNAMYRNKYGITLADYDALLASQGGTCRICRRPPSTIKPDKNLAVDHDHDTGTVRGLLCDMCNVGLGNFRDSAEALEAAANYLREYQ